MKNNLVIACAAVIAATLAVVLWAVTGEIRLLFLSISSAVLTGTASLVHRITSNTRPPFTASGESAIFASATVFSVFTTGLYPIAVPIYILFAPILTSGEKNGRRNIFTGIVITISSITVIAVFYSVSAITDFALSRILSGMGNYVSWSMVYASLVITAVITICAFLLRNRIQMHSTSLELHPLRRRIFIILIIHLLRSLVIIQLFALSGLSALSPVRSGARNISAAVSVIIISLIHYELFHLALWFHYGVLFSAYTIVLGFTLYFLETRTEDHHGRTVRSFFRA